MPVPPGSGKEKPGYATFICEDFIAAVTVHTEGACERRRPNRGQKYINYYGYYSSKSRGLRGDAVIHKKQSGKVKDQKVERKWALRIAKSFFSDKREATEEQKLYKKKWAQLIRKVFEIDPLECPVCGGKMSVVSIIYEKDVIRKILEHLDLWEQDLPPPVEEGYLPLRASTIYEPYDAKWPSGLLIPVRVLIGYTLMLNWYAVEVRFRETAGLKNKDFYSVDRNKSSQMLKKKISKIEERGGKGRRTEKI